MTFGISRHREIGDLHEYIEQERRDEHDRGQPPQAEQDQREDHQEQNVKRQDVEKGRLEFEEECLDDRHMRLVEKVADPHLIVVHRVVEGGDRVGHLGDEDHEEEYVRNIQLPGPAQDARRRI